MASEMVGAAAAWLTEYAEGQSAVCRAAPNPHSCLTPERQWQRPAVNHVWEFAIVNGVAVLAGIVGWRMLKPTLKNAEGRGPRLFGHWAGDALLAAILAACWVAQAWYKIQRNDGWVELGMGVTLPRGLFWMSMPCHAYTLLAILALLSSKPCKAKLLASMCVTFSWNTFLGSAFADFSDQVHWTEPYTFIFHHGLLNVLPLYFAASFDFYRLTPAWLLWSSSVMTLFNMGLECPLSYVSGYNINYHIHPPTRGLPYRVFYPDVYYKPKIIAILVVLSTLSTVLIGAVGLQCRRCFVGAQKAKTQ
eukprot:TRINITY_DN22691_c0_g1_i1.p1 TRINITY_DN22691_c0_g1~~TRINITY_DN22691_c0_g1_i1.p1  ORF type:complete len:305 (+),score=84.75 TRINITY_DN22691_c0_g1_i1:57-971(+)